MCVSLLLRYKVHIVSKEVVMETCPSTAFDALIISWASDPTRRIPSVIRERLIENAVGALRTKREFHSPFNPNSIVGSRATTEDRAALHAINTLLHAVQTGTSQQIGVSSSIVNDGAVTLRK
jgi:hypothetical protein